MIKNFEISYLLDFYGNILTEKQLEAARCYYDEDLSLSEIALNQSISRQGVRDTIKRAEIQLTYMEKKLQLAEKFKKNIKNLEKINSAIENIKKINKNFSFSSRDIQTNAEKIESLVSEIY